MISDVVVNLNRLKVARGRTRSDVDGLLVLMVKVGRHNARLAVDPKEFLPIRFFDRQIEEAHEEGSEMHAIGTPAASAGATFEG